jgi:Ca-activated chloride channel homolog
MTFERPWLLALAVLPAAWVIYSWRPSSRKTPLLLKGLAFVAILCALAEPRITLHPERVAVALLVDTSASISSADLSRASRITSSIAAARGSQWMRVLPFARSSRALAVNEAHASFPFQLTSGEAGRATDLEAAIRDAIAALPAERVPRIALITDGHETRGSIARAAWQARQLGVPIDTFALAGRPRGALRLESAGMPEAVFAGEPFSIDLTVFAASAMPADLELRAEGNLLGTTSVTLAAGVNELHLRANLNTPGALPVAITLRSHLTAPQATTPPGTPDSALPSSGIAARAIAAGPAEIRYDQPIAVRRPRVLHLSGDAEAADAHLNAALAAAQFEVERASEFGSRDLSRYQLVVLNNWELDKVRPADQAALEAYVRRGGGLLVIGGERNLLAEAMNTSDPLDRALPARLVPRSTDGRAVVLVLDRSTSMLGKKIELTRQAAANVVSNLRPTDQVGVLAFDTTFRWQVPMRFADDPGAINALISRINPNGGTRIAQALGEAYRAIVETNAFYKHILLLTDGLSDEGNSFALAREAQNMAITISTVGLGLDVNRTYLTRLASLAGGKAYFLNEPAGLEQIVLSDVKEHTGMTAVEKPLVPEVLHEAEILDGVAITGAPALKGYVRFEAKPNAEIVLRLDGRDPLYSRWQYGLGRSAIFASDAKARWASDWVSWKGFDKFWMNVCRDLLPHASVSDVRLEYDSASGDLVARYRLGANAAEPAAIPELYVIGPDHFQRTMPIQKIALGTYDGRAAIGSREGLFRVRPLEDSEAFPEAALYRPEAELSEYGSNEELLKQVAEFTGGRFQPAAADVFDSGGRTVAVTEQLWPWLLALAMILNVAELTLRKKVRRHLYK